MSDWPAGVTDRAARERALEPAGSFLVQAPAGSGKTELLIQRYLRLLACVKEPEEVLAITFTRKAAAEIRSRILRALRDAQSEVRPLEPHLRVSFDLAKEVLSDPVRRQWDLLGHPARLSVSTIDAVNAWLAGRAPLSAGHAALCRMAADPEELYRAAARETLALIGDSLPEAERVRALLQHLNNDASRFIRMVAAMLPRREQWLRHLIGRRHSRSDLERPIRAMTERGLQAARDAIPPELATRLPDLLAHAAGNLKGMGSTSPVGAWGTLEVLPPATAEALPQWQALANALLTDKGAVRKKVDKNSGFPPHSPLKGEMLETLERCSGLPELVNALRHIGDLPGSGYPRSQWEILEALIDVLPIAAAQLRIVLGSRGETDFPEVAANALQALGSDDEPSDLGLALDIRISHILVDEFQDTSAAQFTLLEKLVAGWQSDDGRTLFLVGDPMQSIYRFREADVRLFLRVHRDGIGGLRPEFLQLRENFRSDPTLVHWCNTIFDQILPAVDDLEFGGSSFAASHPALPTGGDAAVEVHWGPATRGGEGSARDVVSLVCALRRNSPGEDICILVRNRSHAVPILRGLRAAGIGFLAPDMEGLAKSPVAQDLLCLTRALCHRGDRLAWLALLRAPWCGLTLADLHVLAAADRNRDVWDLMHDDDLVGQLGPESRGRLLRVRERLAKPMQFRGRLSLRDMVETGWLRLNGPAAADEPADLQTAGSFLTELDSFDRGGDLADEAALAECLAGMTASLGGVDSRVQVMTIHKAKGLEFDTVLLPALERGQKHTGTRLLLWHDPAAGSGDEPTILAPAPATGGGEDSLYPVLQKFEQRKDQLEQQRLLYVACTRARKRLHLFGELRHSRAQGQPGILPPRTDSLLAHLWIAVQRDAEASASRWEQPDVHAAGDDPWVQLQLRRLPADWEPPAVAASFVPAPGHAPAAGTPPPEFDWAGRWAMHAGAVVHRWLQIFADRGPEQFPAPASEAAGAVFRRMLQRLGTEQRSLEPGTERVVLALTRTLADERGRWILSRDHRNAASELALTVVDGASTRQMVIDRTFVTADGDRWIIDFKTSTHEGGDLNAFLESESVRYREQLAGYRRALMLAGEKRARTALYFPLLGEFRELSFEDS